MNEDPLQEIYYYITKMGYNDRTAQYFIDKYGEDLKKLLQEANRQAEQYKEELLQTEIRFYLIDPNRLNPEYH